MAVETVNDANLVEFYQSKRAVLGIGTSITCPHCQEHASVIRRVSEILGEVRFGQAWLDKLPRGGSVYGLASRLYRDRQTWPRSTTLVSKPGRGVWTYFPGTYGYDDTLEVIKKILNRGEIQPADFSGTLRYILI